MRVGSFSQCYATIYPIDADNQNIIWLSSDSNIVEIEKFNDMVFVNAKSAGKATISAKTEDGGYVATCEITVKNPNKVDVNLREEEVNFGKYLNIDVGIIEDEEVKDVYVVLINENLSNRKTISLDKIDYNTYYKSVLIDKNWSSGIYHIDCVRYTLGDYMYQPSYMIAESYYDENNNLITDIKYTGDSFAVIGSPDDIKEPIPEIDYQVQIKDEGWHEEVENGETAMRDEPGNLQQAMRINVDNSKYSGGIEYCVHVENIGWMPWVSDGNIAGIENTNLRTEALKIRLIGEIAEHYDVYYRTHVQNVGWQNWAKNGEASGSSGAGYRIEGIQIKLVGKDTGAPEFNEYFSDYNWPFYEKVNVIYGGHVENYGDIGDSSLIRNGITFGYPLKHLRVEGIKVRLESTTEGAIEYTTHVENIGWLNSNESDWNKDNEFSGKKGMGLRVEGIKIRLSGEIAKNYSVYYRVFSEKHGRWLDWTKDGNEAGTEGLGSKLEGLQIKVLVHGDPNEPTCGPNALMKDLN